MLCDTHTYTLDTHTYTRERKRHGFCEEESTQEQRGSEGGIGVCKLGRENRETSSTFDRKKPGVSPSRGRQPKGIAGLT